MLKGKPKPNKSENDAPTIDENEGIWKDPRFAQLVSDPRFKNIHRSTKNIKIDKRFKSMFNDDQFKVKYTVDKYGRRVNKSSTDDLEKYYDLSSDDDEEEKRKEETELLKESGDVNAVHESDEELAENVKLKLQDLNVDYARGEIPLLSDSSSDDESSDDGNDKELFIEHVWGELDNEAPRTEESTRRLAACNMDWDRIRASDIMVLCNSFMPPGGSILSVTIYPSEYGQERLAEEEVKGPQELTENKIDSDTEYSDSDREDNEDGVDYHMEKLRQYQLNRLRYYYAVIECNSVHAADKLYAECDGIEYESTATKFDLRFIPDDMTFDDKPKEMCTEMPDMGKYKPRLFTTTALQQAKVELTWDENDVDRKELNEKVNAGQLNDIPDAELRKFVAYSSEEEEEEEAEEKEKSELMDDNDPDSNSAQSNKNLESKQLKTNENSAKPIQNKLNQKSTKTPDSIFKYKNLLVEINKEEEEKKKQRIEMEFSWGICANDNSKVKKNDSKLNTNADVNPFEKIIEKKREKKRARKEEIRKLKKAAKKQANGFSDNDDNNEDDEDNLPDGIDLNDPYFAEEFAKGDFAPPKAKSNKAKKARAANVSDSDEEKDLALLLNDDDNHKAHFSLKKIQENENESKSSKKHRKYLKRKKQATASDKKAVEDDFQINLTDNRFSAIFSSHLYNIDPTDSHYKKTKGMDTIIQEKLKRKPIDGFKTSAIVANGESSGKKRKLNVADSILVKSIKRKVQQH